MQIQPVYESPVPVKVNGTRNPILNESAFSFRPFSGGESGGTYEGADEHIQPLVAQLVSSGFAVEYKRSKNKISSVTFRAAFGSVGGSAVNPNLDYVDTWEVIRNTTQKELLESDLYNNGNPPA